MKQRILVLGGTGFIGRRVVATLNASGWAAPIAASRRPQQEPTRGQHDQLKIDATDAPQLRAALVGVSAVVNCIAGTPKAILTNAKALFGTLSELSQPPPVVHLSSLAVYGAGVGRVDELTPPTKPLSAYGSAKLEAERLAGECASVVILRPGIVYGPESAQWTTRIGSLLVARRIGDLGERGNGYCNLTYVDDVSQAIVSALRVSDAAGSTFNLSMPNPPRWNEYFLRYATALGATPVARIGESRLQVETRIIAPAARISRLVVSRLPGKLDRSVPECIPPSLLRLFAQEIVMNSDRAEAVLGIRWTPLTSGLEQAAEWYRSSLHATPT